MKGYTMYQNVYKTLFGGSVFLSIVSWFLPRLGQHDFKWVVAETINKQYGHYAFRIHPKGSPVNVHVYGDRDVIEYLARTGKPGVFEFEVVEKTTESGKKFVFVNLRLMAPTTRLTHVAELMPKSKSEHRHFFTTETMHGMGVGVTRIED